MDGLLVALTNLADPAINGSCVAGDPSDPEAALAAAEGEFRRRGLPFFSIESERGRHPTLEEAVRRAGLTLSISHPAMAARVAICLDRCARRMSPSRLSSTLMRSASSGRRRSRCSVEIGS